MSDLVLKRDIYYTQYPGADTIIGGLGRSLSPIARRAVRLPLRSVPISQAGRVRSREYPIGDGPISDAGGQQSPEQGQPRLGFDRLGVGPDATARPGRSRGGSLTGKAFYIYWPHGVPIGPDIRSRHVLFRPLLRADEVDSMSRSARAAIESQPSPSTGRRRLGRPIGSTERSRRIESCLCLEVRGLEKWYGRRQVVMGVDFNVDRGEVVGPARPQRRRQDDELPDDDRPDRRRRRLRHVRRPGRHQDGRCTCAPGPAWATSPRIRASSGSCRSKTT